MSDFRIHSRTGNYRGGFSACYGGGRKDYIFSVPKCREFFKYNRCVFSAFTDSPVREDSSVDEVVRCDKTAVCKATRSPADIISISPGTTFAAGNIKLIAVSEYTGMG